MQVRDAISFTITLVERFRQSRRAILWLRLRGRDGGRLERQQGFVGVALQTQSLCEGGLGFHAGLFPSFPSSCSPLVVPRFLVTKLRLVTPLRLPSPFPAGRKMRSYEALPSGAW